MSPQTTPAELPVGHLGFGAMRVTGQGIWGPPTDEGEAIALLRRVVDKGVTFIDTADSYGPGISEMLIAKALYPYPAGLMVATKGGLTPRLCGQPEKAKARAHRALPTTCSGSPDTNRGFGRCARRPPARREDPPYWRVERIGAGACPGARRHQDRLRAELLQSARQIVRRADRYVRRCRHRLYSLVPAGSGRARQPKFAAGPDCSEPRRHAEPDRAGLAAAAFPRHAPNSGDLLDSASRISHLRRSA
jgi:hypothetical protein